MPEKSCPKCKAPWEEEENIYDHFRNRGYSRDKAAHIALMYGCTKEIPVHFGVNVVGIETDKYDGISFWQCKKCDTYFDRWTMEEVDNID